MQPSRARPTVVVRTGDTLEAIAVRTGTTVAALTAAQPRSSTPKRLRVGQRVRVGALMAVAAVDYPGAP